MRIGEKEFDTDRQTYIMGILNVTPDSFSDGGRWVGMDQALYHAEDMIRQGASIIDVGGESTRPGFEKVSDLEEIQRVSSVINEIKNRFDIVVSCDTYKSAVAHAAIASGADMINDIYGLKADPEMAAVIRESGAACCLMHNRMGGSCVYHDFRRQIKEELSESLEQAERAEIPRDRIILDPGVGFAKEDRQNLEAIDMLGELRSLGCPILLGASRKSFIGRILDLPVDQREEGTDVTTVFAVQRGCAFVRVHDVERCRRVIRMTRALMEAT